MKTETFSNAAGQNIFLRSWRPDTAPRGIVVLVHGFNSHSGYYTWTAERLLAQGLAVYALDLRGRGRSEGERFFVDRFDDYVHDVERCINLARARDEGLPTYLLGHSAGGVVACMYELRHPTILAGLICESFAFQLPAPDFALTVLKGLSHITPHVHVLTLHNEDFSRDPEVVRAMNADPLIAHEYSPRRRWRRWSAPTKCSGATSRSSSCRC